MTPCEQCICIPICRHKTFGRLFKECKLVAEYAPEYLYSPCRDTSKLRNIERVLDAYTWWSVPNGVNGLYE